MTETKEMLKLSILYHRLLVDLEAVCDVQFRNKAQAFEIVREFADQLKMHTLAEVVLKEVMRGQPTETHLDQPES